MTEKQKRKLLKNLRHKKLKRFEIEKYCSGKTRFDSNREIDALCTEKMICMASEPVRIKGVFQADSNDFFKLGDLGSDYLADIKRDYVRTYLPIIIFHCVPRRCHWFFYRIHYRSYYPIIFETRIHIWATSTEIEATKEQRDTINGKFG